MNPIKHPLCNDVLRKPEGMTEEECADLHIMRSDNAFGLQDGPTVNSFWKPEPVELAALNAGAPLVLHVCGNTHPPLSVMVLNADPDAATPVKPDASFDRLMAITKRALSAWAVNHPEDKDRANITDQFLDLMAGKLVPDAHTHVFSDEIPAWAEKHAANLKQPSADDAEIERLTKLKDAYLGDALEWKAEAERFEAKLIVISTALGDEWNKMPFDEAITAIKNRLAMAEAARDTERGLRHVAEENLKNLLHYAEDLPGHVPVSGHAVAIRDALVELHRNLRIKRENLLAGIEEAINKAFNVNPAD